MTTSAHLSTLRGRITEAMLERFSFVQVIRGVLLISFWDSSLPEMNFFRNVEYIGGPDLFTESSDGLALSIVANLNLSQGAKSGIRGIDLSKLKRITHGNVSLIANPQLCYYGDFHHDVSQYFQFEGQRVLTRSVFGLDPHLNTTYCGECTLCVVCVCVCVCVCLCVCVCVCMCVCVCHLS